MNDDYEFSRFELAAFLIFIAIAIFVCIKYSR